MSMPAGIQRCSSGSSALMRSTVSMTLASACLLMISSTAGWRSNVAAERVLRVPCSTVGDARQPYDVAVAGLHHDGAVVLGSAQLGVGGDGDRLLVAVDDADRRQRVGLGDGAAHRPPC